MAVIENLTSEQKALIPLYQQKWRAIAFSTEPINHLLSTEIIKSLYNALGQPQPQIYFCSSPYQVLNKINLYWRFHLANKLRTIAGLSSKEVTEPELKEYQLGQLLISPTASLVIQKLEYIFLKVLTTKTSESLDSSLDTKLKKHLISSLKAPIKVVEKLTCQSVLDKFKVPSTSDGDDAIASLFKDSFYNSIIKFIENRNCIEPELWSSYCCYLDYCFNVLKLEHNQDMWLFLNLLIKSCGWVFPLEDTCIICERPIKFSLENNHLTLEYSDGFRVCT